MKYTDAEDDCLTDNEDEEEERLEDHLDMSDYSVDSCNSDDCESDECEKDSDDCESELEISRPSRPPKKKRNF